MGKYEPGDHLYERRGVYQHHGIYVSDDCVIQFGGSNLFRKGEIGIQRVSLEVFTRTGNVKVVLHPSPGRMFGPRWLPGPLPAGQIIAEAERLADMGTLFFGRYALFGSNCEHLANWCVTGNYFESLQVKRFFEAKVFVDQILILTQKRYHQKTWWRALIALSLISTVINQYQWQRAPYKFWKGIDRPQGPGSDWSTK